MNKVGKGVIIEFAQVGAYVKVSAFHEQTMTEVSIVGDPRETEQKLKQTVLQKLRYVLEKSQKPDPDKPSDKKGNKRGIIV
ncbi:hypothetical protein A9Q97_00915 [Rhodospirillales bacterium 47_12_T64]|nr:hypothetical protein A9Q97_00915 [Rhodospirillales bacterium 47_12_T64]